MSNCIGKLPIKFLSMRSVGSDNTLNQFRVQVKLNNGTLKFEVELFLNSPGNPVFPVNSVLEN